MTKQKRWLIYVLLLATLLSFPLANARAEDRAFKAISTHLKTRYKAKRRGIPFMGLANFAFKIVHPAGVKSIKVAIFEDLDDFASINHGELNSVIREALDQEWQPLVRVYSRKDGQQVFVYARDEGQDIKLLVVSLNQTDAFVARVKIDPGALAKFMENPKILGISLKDD
jgi:hypothetical protein